MQRPHFVSRITNFLTVWVLLALPVVATNANEILKQAPSGSYAVDLSHASVVFKVSHLGFSTYVGRFNDFSADLNLDTEDFTKSSVSAAIKVDSIDTAYPFPEKEDFDAKIAGEWLLSKENPLMTFTSTEVGPLLDGKSDVTGDLSMAGQTHPVVLKVTLNNATDSHPINKVAVVGFSATTELDRSVWGVDNSVPFVASDVRIELEGEFLIVE